MSAFFTKYRPVSKKKNVICHANTDYNSKKKLDIHSKVTIVVFHTTLIFITQSSTVLRKNCLCQYFLQDIILHAKKERDLSRKYRLWLYKARHALKGTIVVFYSYDINIYTPAFRYFEKKLLMSGFLERNSFCWAKEERELSRKYTL